MARNPTDILADKILVETGSGAEKNAAQRRLMQDEEDYAESYVRIRELEKKYGKIEAEEERKRAGLTEEEYKWYKFWHAMAYVIMPIGWLCVIIGVPLVATNPDSNVFTIGVLSLVVSWILDKVSGNKLNRK